MHVVGVQFRCWSSSWYTCSACSWVHSEGVGVNCCMVKVKDLELEEDVVRLTLMFVLILVHDFAWKRMCTPQNKHTHIGFWGECVRPQYVGSVLIWLVVTLKQKALLVRSWTNRMQQLMQQENYSLCWLTGMPFSSSLLMLIVFTYVSAFASSTPREYVTGDEHTVIWQAVAWSFWDLKDCGRLLN